MLSSLNGSTSTLLIAAKQSLQTTQKASPDGLTEDEQKQVQELKKQDSEIRAHEQAHKTAGGPYASSPSFETVTGPDGREYAVSGEVKIDSSPVPNNPEATIRKMEVVIRAALAPAQPSSQDQQVAQQAQQAKLQAQSERTSNDENALNGNNNNPNEIQKGIEAFIQAEETNPFNEIAKLLDVTA